MAETSRNKDFRFEESIVRLTRNYQAATSSKDRLHDINIENLKIVLNYFTHLKTTGKLKEKQFNVLIKKTCAIFVQNELAVTVNTVLSRSLKHIFGV
jgi:hypothetical protein